jgi:hypothetical protein
MESAEEQIIIKTMDEGTSVKNSDTKSHNPGLRALLSIKKLSFTLDKHFSELEQIESELHIAYKSGLFIIKANTSPEGTALWEEVSRVVNKAVEGIHDTLTGVKEMIVQNEKNGYPELWKELAVQLTVLKENSKNAVNSGWKLLPEAVHLQWETEFVKAETSLVESLIIHVDSCRVLLQMIESYTPVELNAITRMIANHIPIDFTYAEAEHYQNDYNKALVNFKNEFKKEKNLWDKFLDILAGGTHQSPSERVMMERWVDGEESNL